MKKIIALLLALVMVLGLAACAAKTEAPKVEEPAKTEDTKTEEPKAEEPKAEEPKAEEKENVTIDAYIVATEWGDAFDEMEAGFEAEYPWINVEPISRGGGDSGQYLVSAISFI